MIERQVDKEKFFLKKTTTNKQTNKQESIPVGCQQPFADRACFIMNKFERVRGGEVQ